ncbi:MAG: hypothetical protein ACPHES_05255, partial [Ilumatobacteraceae bacterium]
MSTASGHLLAISSGQKSVMTHGSRSIETAFHKQPLAGVVTISPLGIEDDEHVYEHHGGPDDGPDHLCQNV